jgi:hypothetical protein
LEGFGINSAKISSFAITVLITGLVVLNEQGAEENIWTKER